MQVGGVFLNENMESRSVFYDKEASLSREKPLVVRTKYEMKPRAYPFQKCFFTNLSTQCRDGQAYGNWVAEKELGCHKG